MGTAVSFKLRPIIGVGVAVERSRIGTSSCGTSVGWIAVGAAQLVRSRMLKSRSLLPQACTEHRRSRYEGTELLLFPKDGRYLIFQIKLANGRIPR